MIVKLAVAALAVTSVAAVALSSAPPTEAAQPAQFVRCVTNPVQATAIGHGILGVDKRVTVIAIANWQSAASQSVGDRYSDWSHALGGRVECHRHIFEVTCLATATPCRS